MAPINGGVIDEETDLKLEMLRREIQLNRDIKSQITMFNAGKVSEGGNQGCHMGSEDFFRYNEYLHPGKIRNVDLIV